MASTFFYTNNYFIDEKVNLFGFENNYKVFNDQGVEIGSIKQKLSGNQKFLRLLLNKAMLPFRLEIRDNNNVLQASVNRGWTWFTSKITILDANENQIGIIKQKFRAFKPKFMIYSISNQHIATIKGDWKAWNFEIKDVSENNIGKISKKWAGAVKEIFTTADKYNVSINPEYTNNNSKVVVVAAAVTIDMVLKESK